MGVSLSRIEPHRQARFRHVLLGFPHAVLAEMEDRGRQHRRGVAVADTFNHMSKRAYPAGSDDRHRDGVGDRAGERDVIALRDAVAVHRGEQNFAGASLTRAHRFTAAVLIDTLSAPQVSSLRISSTVRTPPPTVSGMKQE